MKEKYVNVYSYAKYFIHMQVILPMCQIFYAHTSNFMYMQFILWIYKLCYATKKYFINI